MIVFGFKKHEILLKPWKFLIFFRKYMGKMVGAGAEIFDKLEPEPKFLTSWSRKNMDRLRNTGFFQLLLWNKFSAQNFL
jgi:hypothetical protein